MSKIIGVFSAKGGVGKTTTAINLASSLNEFGRKVLVIDTDLKSPNLGIYLGGHDMPNTLNKVLSGTIELKDAIYMHSSGIYTMIGSINPIEADKQVDYKRINEILGILRKSFEFLIVDTAPGHNEEDLRTLDEIDEIVIITTPDMIAVTDALRTVVMAKKAEMKIIGTAITRVGTTSHDMTKLNIEAMLGIPVIAEIPEDKRIPLSAKVKSPVIHSHPEAKATIAYKKLAALILGEEYEVFER